MARLKELEEELLGENKMRKQVSLKVPKSTNQIGQIELEGGPQGGAEDQINDNEQLDKVMEELQINIVAFGFPDCGNLRSTKRKDIKMRIKCMQQMLKQRKKDFEFRNGIQAKMSKVNCDEEAL